MKSQVDLIYTHMKEIGPITPLVAFEEYNCLRLGARIDDLKKAGIAIEDRWVTYKSPLGQTKRYKEYRLA